MYMTFEGRKARLYTDHGSIIRQFNMDGQVLQASCSGGDENHIEDIRVTIVESRNGKNRTSLYQGNGSLIRRV